MPRISTAKVTSGEEEKDCVNSRLLELSINQIFSERNETAVINKPELTREFRLLELDTAIEAVLQ
jgi:hypothetical protein